jgi:hypothetical protein
VSIAFGFIGEFILRRSNEVGSENWGKAISCDPPQYFPGNYRFSISQVIIYYFPGNYLLLRRISIYYFERQLPIMYYPSNHPLLPR